MEQLGATLNQIVGTSMGRPMSQSSDECSACNGTGWIHPPGIAAVTRCDCQKQRVAAERIRTVLEEWPEYATAKLEDQPANLMQAEALKVIRGDPTGSYLIRGYYGSGKTHLLIAQYRHMALAGIPCILRSSRQLMEELRKAEAPKQQNDPNEYVSQVWLMANTAPAGHLFWDDVEKAAARSEFRAEAVFDLLDTLKRRQLGITVTSNLSLAELTGVLGDAAVARIDRMCTQIQL
jgi:DNA replication protein DnaC